MARSFGADVTILHIVEAVQYHYPTSDQMEAHWKDLLQTVSRKHGICVRS